MRLYVHLNGRILPEERACVSVFDRGLSYGDGLYETLKAYEGAPLFLKEHLKRLRAGASFLGFTKRAVMAFEGELKGGAVEALLKKNGLARGEAYVKLMITRGADKASHLPTKGITPTFIIIAKPLDTSVLARARSKGVEAVFVDDMAPALPGVKSLNYLASVIAKIRADRKKAYEAIFVREGFITEGTSSNIFMVKNGKILTPPLEKNPSKGVLAGVTRDRVMKIAVKNGIPLKEARIRPSDMAGADEAFITNSITDAVPLIKTGGKAVGDGRPGPVTRQIQTLLSYRP
ncbi:MAG: hypothetical protein A2V21_310900 [Deltaproteobacteria bacterium GWC2_55_46]|nr:MAG: hypothetical protein A2Z79_07890 [Deltaproteobacteria bacterium GWA2_55_82]OGQ65149.1 MAG: hypothetical protein A3I81_07310 [Deltaproteobacteria bacterium RIFCSPLOWO2_02_FULL_55_12]OIJ74725.1 MAG: hypothetical protein A2V21_310900 [Deltaproteobacteria bacterium GWC2_55_46]